MADGKIEIDLEIKDSKAQSQGKKAGDEIAKGVEQGIKNVGKAADSAAQETEKSFKNAANSAKSSFSDVGSAAKNSFGDVGDAAKNAASDASSAFEEIPADAEGAFSDVSSEAESGFDGVADAAQNASGDAASAFQEIPADAEGAFSDVASEAQAGFDGVPEAAQNAASETADAFDGVADEIGSDIEGAGSTAQGVFGSKIPAAAAVAAGAITAVAAAALDIGKNAIETGAEFDKAMSQVAATMGVPKSEISELTEFAKQMGETTAFSASEAAEALNYMALAGYDTETSMRVLPTVLNLAAAGNMDLARASDMVTDAQSALGLSVEEAEIMVDQMATTSSKTNTSVSQLGDAFLTVGGTAKNLSGGTKELSQMLGILADNGIKGAEGGTALRNVILSLSAPTDKAAESMEQLGLQVFDAEGNMRPMPDIFNDLNAAMAPLSQKERTELLNNIFNKVDLKSVNALLGTSADRFDEVAGAIDNAQGSAQKMADTQLDNLAGDVTLLQSATEGFFIAVSDQLSPALRGLTQFGTNTLLPFLTNAAKNFDKIAPLILGVGTAIAVMAGKGAAVKALASVFDTLKTKVAGSTKAFDAMSTSEKAAAVATKGLGTALKALQSIGIMVAITAAVELLALFTENAAKASEQTENLSKATDGITGVMDSYNKAFNDAAGSMKSATDGAETYGHSLGEIRAASDEAIAKTAALADSLNETFSTVGTNNAMVSVYADTIEELAGKSNLTAEEQGRLITAVNGLNDIMGTSYSVVDAQNGILSENTDEILKSAEAWKQRALMEAQASAAEEIMERMVENTTALRKAEDLLNTTQEKLAQAQANGVQDLTHYRLGVEEAQAEVDRLNDVQDSLNDEYNDLSVSIADLNNELSTSNDSLLNYLNSSSDWSSSINDAEISAEDFAKALSDLGVSTQDLSNIVSTEGEAGIRSFIEAYQAGGDELTAWMQEFGFNLQTEAQNTGEELKNTATETSQGITEAVVTEQENTLAAVDSTEQGMVEHLQQAVPEMSEVATEATQGVTTAIIDESGNAAAATEGLVDGVDAAASGLPAAMEPHAKEASQGVTSEINGEAGNTASAASSTVKRVDSEFSQMTTDTQRNASQTMDALSKGIQSGTPAAVSAADNVSKQVADHFSSAKGDARQAGNSMSGEHFAGGIEQGRNQAVAAADSTSKQVADHFSSASNDAYNAGYNMAMGMANGINAGQNAVVNAAVAAVRAANAAAKAAANEHSPSKIWREIGQFMSLGAALGITDKKQEVVDAAKEVVEEVNDAATELTKALSDEMFIELKFKGNPMAQLNESMLRGASASNFAAMAGSMANNYNNSTQNLNFYGDYQSPDVIAREMRMQQRYGLAGEYV